MNILGVITARGGSKEIPQKNVKLLGDKPLIAYTIEIAKKSKLITNLITSTDDKKIANIAKKYGSDVPFIRPAELAKDDTPHLPVMRHAVEFMEHRTGIRFNYVVILQPTSPFRAVSDLDGTINKLIETKADSAVSLVEIEDNHPVKIKKLDGDRVMSYYIEEEEGMRRQDFPIAYKRSGAVYVMKRDTLMVKNRLYGDFVVGFVVPKERSIDIDTPLEWLKAEHMLKELKKKIT